MAFILFFLQHLDADMLMEVLDAMFLVKKEADSVIIQQV